MKFPDIIYEALRTTFCCLLSILYGNKIGHLGNAIHNYPDRRTAIRLGKLHDEVHGNSIPRRIGQFKRVQRAMPLMSGRFVLLAVFTTTKIVLDILSHFWPVEVSVDQFHGFIHAHMAGHTTVVLALHYQFAERGITGDLDFAFVEEHPIFIHDKHSNMPLKGSIFRSFVVQLLPDRIALCL